MVDATDSQDPAEVVSLDTEQAGDAKGRSTTCEWEHVFGGQAVMEGVMMRGRFSWGLAVRRPSGSIARFSYPLKPAAERPRWLRLPVVRGVVALYESLSLGVKAMGIAANVSLEEATEEGEAPAVSAETSQRSAFGWKELAGTLTVAVALAVGLFIVVPLVVARAFGDALSNGVAFTLVEGAVRLVMFLLYIGCISLLPDLRRVFQYHGAEHKVIHAYEACGHPDAEGAAGESPLHPRCGTGFLLVVMVIAILVFAAVGKRDLEWLVVSRIVGIPVIVGISYEVGIKWLGKHPNSRLARFLLWPGLQLQRLTTREPSADQLEVAAAALDEVMKKDEARQLELRGAEA